MPAFCLTLLCSDLLLLSLHFFFFNSKIFETVFLRYCLWRKMSNVFAIATMPCLISLCLVGIGVWLLRTREVAVQPGPGIHLLSQLAHNCFCGPNLFHPPPVFQSFDRVLRWHLANCFINNMHSFYFLFFSWILVSDS